jgi:hypothetical protein
LRAMATRWCARRCRCGRTLVNIMLTMPGLVPGISFPRGRSGRLTGDFANLGRSAPRIWASTLIPSSPRNAALKIDSETFASRQPPTCAGHHRNTTESPAIPNRGMNPA